MLAGSHIGASLTTSSKAPRLGEEQSWGLRRPLMPACCLPDASTKKLWGSIIFGVSELEDCLGVSLESWFACALRDAQGLGPLLLRAQQARSCGGKPKPT